jgi:DHA1 family tetracycline resistance protein-like MFS transporter
VGLYDSGWMSLPEPRARQASFVVVLLIVFLDLVGFGIIVPMLPFYVPGDEEHPLQVGLLFSIYSACQFVGAPILGALSDRYGRRPVLAFSQVGSAIGYAMLAAATLVEDPTWRLAVVYLSRVIDGFTGGNISTAHAYIADVTDEKTRAGAMGKMGAAFGLGFVAGPALGGILGHYHVGYPPLAAAILSILAGIGTVLFVVEPHRHRSSGSEMWFHPRIFVPVFRNGVLTQLLLIMSVSMAAFVMLEATFTLYLNAIFGWGEREVGFFFAGVGMVIVVVQGVLVGRLTLLWGEWPLAIGGLLLCALGMAVFTSMAWLPLVALVVAGGLVNSTGRSLQQPTLSSLISKTARPEEQGLVFGLTHGLLSLARVVGPLVAGLAYPLWRNTGAYIVSGLLLTFTALWAAAVWRQAPRAARAALEVVPVEAPQKVTDLV